MASSSPESEGVTSEATRLGKHRMAGNDSWSLKSRLLWTRQSQTGEGSQGSVPRGQCPDCCGGGRRGWELPAARTHAEQAARRSLRLPLHRGPRSADCERAVLSEQPPGVDLSGGCSSGGRALGLPLALLLPGCPVSEGLLAAGCSPFPWVQLSWSRTPVQSGASLGTLHP